MIVLMMRIFICYDDDVQTRFATSYRFSPHFSPNPDAVYGGYSIICISMSVQQITARVSACSSSASFNMCIGTATSSTFELTTTDRGVSSQLSNGDYQWNGNICEPSHGPFSLANTATTSSTAVVGCASSCTVSSDVTLESSSLPKGCWINSLPPSSAC